MCQNNYIYEFYWNIADSFFELEELPKKKEEQWNHFETIQSKKMSNKLNL